MSSVLGWADRANACMCEILIFSAPKRRVGEIDAVSGLLSESPRRCAPLAAWGLLAKLYRILIVPHDLER